MRNACLCLGLLACAAPAEDVGEVDPDVLPDAGDAFPAADAWGGTTGPGIGKHTWDEGQLFEHCAYLAGGEGTVDHHNLLVVNDGYVLFPWAPEWGGGGLSLMDFSNPCEPVLVGEAWSDGMRESHSLGISVIEGRTYVAVDYITPGDPPSRRNNGPGGGVGFFDITDPAAPFWVGGVEVEGHAYPDSYTRLTLALFWQGPYVYAATASLGVFIIDASDPHNPEVVGNIGFDGPHLVGSFHVWGNRAMAATAGLGRTVLMDISDPLNAFAVPGGDFTSRDAAGRPVNYYFANLGAEHALFARSSDGGGLVVWDVTDASAPVEVSVTPNDDGDGGYVFQHEDYVFLGDSQFGTVYDFADPSNPVGIGTFNLKGDLDTVTPLGNVAAAAVDEDGDPGQATAIVPWRSEPDDRGPRPGMTSPLPGATRQALTSRVGVVFDELLEPVSAFAGSFRVMDAEGTPVAGHFNVQENIVNFTPTEPLAPSARYWVHLPAGGITDVSGNPMDDELVFHFDTVGAAESP